MFEFSYLPEGIRSPPPPSVSVGNARWFRPYINLRVRTATGITYRVARALLDTGSQDTIFPLATAAAWGVPLLPPTRHVLRWRGSSFPLRFGSIEILLHSPTDICRWTTIVAFIPVQMHYPLLGIHGFLEYFDTTFRGENRVVELIPNGSFAGVVEPLS